MRTSYYGNKNAGMCRTLPHSDLDFTFAFSDLDISLLFSDLDLYFTLQLF